MTLREEWIRQLRSGKYPQGHSYLRCKREGAKEEQYCCLGIGARVVSDAHPDIPVHSGTVWEYDGDFERLTPRLCELLDLSQSEMEELITMNDVHGYSFEDIADYLEYGSYDRT
jgi:hypothetical protein